MVETKTVVQTNTTARTVANLTRPDAYFCPRVDIYENDEEVILNTDMPGIRPEDVELHYERGELLLHGRLQARERHGELLYQEYEEGDFYRAFTIHDCIDGSKIHAKCNSGVLTVHFPKVAAAQPMQITVQKQR